MLRTTGILWPALAAIALAGCAAPSSDAASEAVSAADAPPAPGLAERAAALSTAVNPFADPRDQVMAAHERFLAAHSYSVAIESEGPTAGRVELDHVAPDRYRLRMDTGTQTIIGDQMYMQMHGRVTRMTIPAGMTEQWRDPARLSAEREAAAIEPLGDDSVDGAPASRYRIVGSEGGDPVLLWIGRDGYPLKVEVSTKDAGGTVLTTVRYSRFNDPEIRIEAPQ